MSAQAHQIVVFGATSFVGQILTRYLYERHGAGGALRWAIAGRSAAKLKALRDELGTGAAALPMIVADADDETALRGLCASTTAVVSTVGPYALYGSTLVKVCAETGTDYCDLTGEPQWIARMIAAYGDTARKSGARIVHCCGFDSLPSDLGTLFLQNAAKARFGAPFPRVKLRVRALRGGFSGGTIASLMNALREVAKDPEVRRQMADPYALCGPSSTPRPRQPDVRFAEYDADAGSWVAPFVMAGINTRVVHRSNLLSGHAYGQDFVYDEATLTGKGFKGGATATGMGLGLGGFVLAAVLPPTRWLLESYALPKPGEGPSPEQQRTGSFDIRLYGVRPDGKKLVAKVTGDRDPGYGSTGKMLGEAVVCLALDVPKSEVGGGFWTPATALGERLIRRLTQHAGLGFSILD